MHGEEEVPQKMESTPESIGNREYVGASQDRN